MALARSVCLVLTLSGTAARVGDSWGTNIHWTSPQPGEATQLAAAYRFARMDLTWAAVEATQGVYNFSCYDTLVATAQAAGFKLYLIFDYFNPLYDGGKPPYTEQGFNAFAAYAFAAVQRYAGKGFVWECQNEPNGAWFWPNPNATQYAILAKRAGVRIKASYPSEMYVGPTTAGFDWNYLNTTFQNGVLQYFDAVSVHPYRNGPPESVLADYASLHAMISLYTAKDVPIVSGEWGWTTCNLTACGTDGDHCGLRDQSVFLPRQWLTNTMAGVPVSIYYDWKNDGGNYSYSEDNFGTVHGEAYQNSTLPYVPKPSYTAAATLQSVLGDAYAVNGRVAATVLPGPGPSAQSTDVFVVSFEGSSGPMFAAWTNVSMCASSFASRTDCGYYGISADTCVRRGCCFNELQQPGQGPQCYFPLPLLQVSFPATAGACFKTVSYLGDAGSNVCADASGAVTIPVSDAPIYLV